jgi:hypothetical protein
LHTFLIPIRSIPRRTKADALLSLSHRSLSSRSLARHPNPDSSSTFVFPNLDLFTSHLSQLISLLLAPQTQSNTMAPTTATKKAAPAKKAASSSAHPTFLAMVQVSCLLLFDFRFCYSPRSHLAALRFSQGSSLHRTPLTCALHA